MIATAGLVLAAGAGRRMGAPKAAVVLAGVRLVDRQVAMLRAAGCDPVVVVLGAALLDVPGAVVAVNPGWQAGMGTSLAVGLASLVRVAPGAAAAAVVLVDQPLLTGAAVTRTVEALGDAPASRATWAGRPGHPVVFARSVWDEVAGSASGDAGARGWLAEHRDAVVAVPCDGLGDDRDVDTRAEVTALEPGDGPSASASRSPATGDPGAAPSGPSSLKS